MAYVDDSGDSKNGTTLSALLVEPEHWSGVLDAWLAGRREVHAAFGVRKHAELHATRLYKGRGKFCESPEQDAAFGGRQRAATGRIVLSHLSQYEHFHVVTVGTTTVSKSTVYAQFVAYLEDWAASRQTELVIFYDGPQGIQQDDGSEISREELAAQWESALRNAAPYRRVHRDLDIGRRRVVEDPIMQDSRYSQLIQAVDLIAYGAYHRHLQARPDIWGTKNAAVPEAIRAYMTTRSHWLPDSDDNGVVWLG
ncbi:DUF3800 domain-containing protein [Cellulomonas sp. ACRRI]|nr:DUF3800 domain-containing protein [Cellulomonas sp. ACRRI]